MTDPVDWFRRESRRLGLPLDDEDLTMIAGYVDHDTDTLATLRTSATCSLEPPFLLRLPVSERPDT